MSVEWDEELIAEWADQPIESVLMVTASWDVLASFAQRFARIARTEHIARLDAEARKDGWKLDAEANLRRYERLAYDYEVLAAEKDALTENIERALKILNDIPAIFDSLEYDGLGNNINEAIAILMGLKND